MTEGIFAAIGLMCLLKHASILDFIRTPLMKLSYFEKLFACSLCLGFWAGIAVAFYFHFIEGQTYWLMPLISCAACWMFDGILGAIQAVEWLTSKDGEPEEDQ